MMMTPSLRDYFTSMGGGGGGWKDNIRTDLTERTLIVPNRACEQDDLAGYVKTGNVLTW